MAVNIGINIQRSPNRINQELRDAAVLGKFPKLFLDFKDQYYLASGGSKTLANAVTHSMSSNSVMTDGYGPELLTNGSFSDGTANWTANEGFSVSNGVATVTTTSGTVAAKIQQSFATEVGKTYILTLNLIARVPSFKTSISSSGFTNSGDLYAQNTNDLGRQSVVFTATTTTTYLVLIANTTNAGKSVSFDNVSVREMPVLKWAPHNLLSYSEDLTNGAYNKAGASVTADQATAPDGTTTADLLTSSDTTAQHQVQAPTVSFVSGQKYTNTWFVKSGTHDYVQVLFFTAAFGSNAYANFDLSTGATGTVGSSATASITDVGNDWYRLEVTADATTTATSRTALNFVTSSTASRNESWDANGTETVYVWGAHLYRSDLGGMVDNPERGDSYVPTTSSAKFLSRVGHHVYNGSAWANEGLLAESEARTNLLTYSTPDSNWSNSDSTDTANQAIAPDGTQTATLLVDTTANANHYISSPNTTIASGAVTGSMYVKRESISYARLRLDGTSGNRRAWFDIENGTVGSVDANAIATMQDVGNGWYRLSLTEPDNTNSGTAKLQLFLNTADSETSYVGDGSGAYLWGAQLEQGSTPSSLIPTDAGSSATKAAESFTIPSANLPWPSPNYIGSELVTNGTFDTDSDWTLSTNVSISSGKLNFNATNTNFIGANQSVSFVSGKVYQISVDVDSVTSGEWQVFVARTSGDKIVIDGASAGSFSGTYVSDGTETNFYVARKGATTLVGVFDNVSVREIDPLSVSFAIDGRVNYTDEGTFTDDLPFYWLADANNRIDLRFDGNSTNVGRPLVVHRIAGDQDLSAAPNAQFFEDGEQFQPFNIAGRITSTKVQGAFDGITGTENTITDGLVDLSSTDLRIAFNYMGSLGTVRIWDKDITDNGLVEATNPELEPSLSLEFEGSGTNSYVINDWSE